MSADVTDSEVAVRNCLTVWDFVASSAVEITSPAFKANAQSISITRIRILIETHSIVRDFPQAVGP
jgi:hypothetical protein